MRRLPVVITRPATARSRGRIRLGSQSPAGLAVPGQEPGPDQELGGELCELEPELVLVDSLERELWKFRNLTDAEFTTAVIDADAPTILV